MTASPLAGEPDGPNEQARLIIKIKAAAVSQPKRRDRHNLQPAHSS
jgi:hypothetical protein